MLQYRNGKVQSLGTMPPKQSTKRRRSARPKKPMTKVQASIDEFLEKYQLADVPGELLVVPLYRLVDLHGEYLHLKPSRRKQNHVLLQQTKKAYPMYFDKSQWHLRDLSLLVVYHERPPRTLDLPRSYGYVKLFYAHRPGDPQKTMIREEDIEKRKRAQRVFEYDTIDQMINFLMFKD